MGNGGMVDLTKINPFHLNKLICEAVEIKLWNDTTIREMDPKAADNGDNRPWIYP